MSFLEGHRWPEPSLLSALVVACRFPLDVLPGRTAVARLIHSLISKRLPAVLPEMSFLEGQAGTQRLNDRRLCSQATAVLPGRTPVLWLVFHVVQPPMSFLEGQLCDGCHLS